MSGTATYSAHGNELVDQCHSAQQLGFYAIRPQVERDPSTHPGGGGARCAFNHFTGQRSLRRASRGEGSGADTRHPAGKLPG